MTDKIQMLDADEHATYCLIVVKAAKVLLNEGKVDEARAIVELASQDEVPVHAVLDHLYDDYVDGKLDDELCNPFVEYLLDEIG